MILRDIGFCTSVDTVEDEFDGEILPAILATAKPRPRILALQDIGIINNATLRAHRASGPHDAFDVGVGGLFVVEDRV